MQPTPLTDLDHEARGHGWTREEASRIIACSMVLAIAASRLESSCGVFSPKDAELIAEIVAAATLDEWNSASGCPFGMQIARIRRPDGLEWVELRVFL